MSTVRDEVASLFKEFQSRFEVVLSRAKQEALYKVREAMEDMDETVAPRQRGPGRPQKLAAPGTPPKPRKGGPRRNSWEGLSDEQRLARVNSIRKGKGLPPKDSL